MKWVQEKKQYTDKAAELKAEYVKARESDKAEDRDVRFSQYFILIIETFGFVTFCSVL